MGMEFNNTKLSSKNNESTSADEGQTEYKKIDKEVESYTDIEGLSTKQLNFGLWYVQNRKKIRGIVAVFLISVASISWLYSIYHFVHYYAIGIKEDERMVREIIENPAINHDYIISRGPRNLAVSGLEILRSNGGRYDLFVRMQNPNSEYSATFDYCFSARGEAIECSQDFILPNSSKYLMSLAQDDRGGIQNADFRITKMNWQRINLKKYPDWEKFQSERLNFQISGASFTPGSASGLSEQISLNTLEFTVKNNTAYNYWSVPLNIVLYGGPAISGVNKYEVTEFRSGESRNISFNWPGNLGGISDIVISPDLNILKDDIYMRYEGGTDILK